LIDNELKESNLSNYGLIYSDETRFIDNYDEYYNHKEALHNEQYDYLFKKYQDIFVVKNSK
jgi:hypothetical protein